MPYVSRGPKRGALVGGIAGTLLLVGTTICHAVTFLFGGSAGGRTKKHSIEPGRIEQLIGIGLSLGTIVLLLVVVSMRARAGQAEPRTAHRIGVLYVFAALIVLVLTGRRS